MTQETELYEALAKVRDHAYGMGEALDKLIQQQSKVVLKEYDVEKIAWDKADGEKGPYERTDDVNNNEYKALRDDLAKHDGKFNHKGMFYWVLQNGTTIGRKTVNRKA